MDSRCSKDSNDILFAIFGPRDQKLWISEVWTEFWFENKFEILFEFPLSQEPPRGVLWYADTVSVRSVMWAARSYEDRMHQISPYPFT
jgi:hypothetical protein